MIIYGRCAICLKKTKVRTDTGECAVCWAHSNDLRDTQAPFPPVVAKPHPLDKAELDRWQRIAKREFAEWMVRTGRWIALDPYDAFITSSPDPTKHSESMPRYCRECWRDGITTPAPVDPVRPWERPWRLCAAHATKERRARNHPRSNVPCVACKWRYDRRKGGAFDEACWKAWQRERSKGMGWDKFAAIRLKKERSHICELSLACAEQINASTCDDWRGHWNEKRKSNRLNNKGIARNEHSPFNDPKGDEMTPGVEITVKAATPELAAETIRQLVGIDDLAITAEVNLAKFLPFDRRRSA